MKQSVQSLFFGFMSILAYKVAKNYYKIILFIKKLE